MLLNGLGHTIVDAAADRRRVVDLFTGSGAVAWFVAESTALPVMAVDLQEYAVALARAVVNRTRPADAARLTTEWILPTRKALIRSRQRTVWQAGEELSPSDVKRAREICTHEAGGPIWRAYGGHYYSPEQAHALDLLLTRLPLEKTQRDICLAATVIAASRCAAAPGHTAQPFQPTQGALPYIASSWKRSPLIEASAALDDLARRHAGAKGRALRGDAIAVAKHVRETDLVILDPPYSSVQYSRFYHVLETIAQGEVGEVGGVGRYPAVAERARSRFSLRTEAQGALRSLLSVLAGTGCTVVLTFPEEETSNGLSGAIVRDVAASYFRVVSTRVATRFSTLGGNNTVRPARHEAQELILTLSPR